MEDIIQSKWLSEVELQEISKQAFKSNDVKVIKLIKHITFLENKINELYNEVIDEQAGINI